MVIKMRASQRFCESCEKRTRFEYNEGIGHSECSKCGWRKVILGNKD